MLNLDTHIFLFALEGSLTKAENKMLSSDNWSISSIVLWEIYKLNQLNRIDIDLDHPDFYLTLSSIHIWNLNLQVFKALEKLDFKNDPVDEIIAATSIAFNVPLVTRDQKIRKSKVTPLARQIAQ